MTTDTLTAFEMFSTENAKMALALTLREMDSEGIGDEVLTPLVAWEWLLSDIEDFGHDSKSALTMADATFDNWMHAIEAGDEGYIRDAQELLERFGWN